MTVLVRLGAVESRRFGFELVKPSSVVVTGSGSESATVSALGSVEFSAATGLSLNDVFSSGYDNYMVVMSGTSSAGDLGIQLRYRASGTDASGSDYTHQRIVAQSTTISGARSSSQTAAIFGFWSPTLKNGDVAYIYGPALAQPTASRNVNVDTSGSATIIDYAATHSLSTAYDGFTMFVGANSITGRVAVYGMRG